MTDKTPEWDGALNQFTAHCFFAGTRDHVETGSDPDAVHAAMEDHYDHHEDEITAALNGALVLGVTRR